MIALLLFLSLLFSFDASAQIIGSGVRQAPGVNCNDGSANAPGRKVDLADPDCSAPTNSWVAVTNGIAVYANDGVCTTYATFADSESEDTNAVRKATGLSYTDGQCLYYFTGQTPGTRDIWGKLRVRDTIPLGERRIWASFSPFTVGYPAASRTDLNLTPTPSFTWVKIANDVSIAAEGALFIATTWAIEFDSFYITTNDAATEGISPAGAPSTGITHNATGTAASGSSTSLLQPSITIAAGSNRVLFAGISHRDDENTIGALSSNQGGTWSLVHWTSNGIIGCAAYKMIAPAVATHTVDVPFSVAQNAVVGLVAYNGVDQSAPTSAVSTATGSNDPSISVAGAADQLAINHLCVSVDNAETVTVTSPQTQRYQKEVDIAGGANRIDVWSDKQADTSTSTGAAITGTRVWVVQTFTIKPPSAGGGAPTVGTPTATLIGRTRLTIEADSSDASSLCTVQYDTDTGAPYANETSSVGVTGGKAIVTVTGLAENTLYFYRVKCNNGSDGFGAEGSSTTDSLSTGIWTVREKAEWLTRSSVGPYRNLGDVSTNSPGEYTRILTNSALSLSAQRWSGNTANKCWATIGQPPSDTGTRIRDAAFVAWLTGNTTLRDAVRDELLAQAAVTGTIFTNTTRWCITNGVGNYFQVSHWIAKMAVAYDYIRADISAGNRTTLDAWILGAGNWLEANVSGMVAAVWPDRASDSYTQSPAVGNNRGNVYFLGTNGPPHYEFYDRWDNQSAAMMRTFGLIGVILNNSTLKNSAKRFFREYFMFSVHYTDSANITTPSEYFRCCSSDTARFPALGWGYTGSTLSEMSFLAEIIARSGDDSLYTYSTSSGYSGTVGGPKSLLAAITTQLNSMDHTLIRYGIKTSGEFGGSIAANIIDNIYTGNNAAGVAQNWHSIGDTWISIANLYFRNDYIKGSYLRTNSGQTAYPASPAGGPEFYSGPGKHLPSYIFMFGQMEGKVWPYP